MPPVVHEVLRFPGQPIDPATRAFMEPRFQHDFSGVRIHTDGQAARSASAINAHAYTVGRSIVFGAEQYAPKTAAGRRLLSHELTHVVQQGGAAYEPYQPLTLAPPDSPLEREANSFKVDEPARLIDGASSPLIAQRQVRGTVGSDPTHKHLTSEEKERLGGFLRAHQLVIVHHGHRAWLDGESISIKTLVARVRREAQILLADSDVMVAYLNAQSSQGPLRLQRQPGIPEFRTALSAEPSSAQPSGRSFLQPGGLLQGELGFHLTSEDRQHIFTFLQEGHLEVGAGLQPRFRGESASVESLAEMARALVMPNILRTEVKGVVSGEWLRILGEYLRHLPPLPPIRIPFPSLPPLPPTSGPDLQSTFGGQWTWHMDRPGHVERSVQVGLTRGAEVYQFQVNLDTGDVQALAGFQYQTESRPLSLIGGVFKAAAFLQLLGGITTARGAASGNLTFQVQAGVQITATFGPVSVSVQIAPSLTLQQNQSPALDFNVAPQGGMSKLPDSPLPPAVGVPILDIRF